MCTSLTAKYIRLQFGASISAHKDGNSCKDSLAHEGDGDRTIDLLINGQQALLPETKTLKAFQALNMVEGQIYYISRLVMKRRNHFIYWDTICLPVEA